MGFDHSAYVAYGVQIDVNPYEYDEHTGLPPGEQVDQALSVPTVKEACPDVGHLQAGDYDRNKFFLTTAFHEAGYEPQFIADLAASSEADELDWERQIFHLIDVMGWTKPAGVHKPGWFVVADCS